MKITGQLIEASDVNRALLLHPRYFQLTQFRQQPGRDILTIHILSTIFLVIGISTQRLKDKTGKVLFRESQNIQQVQPLLDICQVSVVQ